MIAATNPGARVVGIDVSEASLDHQRHLKDVNALGNLELMRMPIEQVGDLGRDFDLVMTTGVLHHMADPVAGMTALGGCLRPEGVLAVMLYAHYGRLGVEMLAGAFADMGLQQDEQSLQVVKEAIALLPDDHPLRAYIDIAPDLAFDAGVVDTFLHGRQRSYTVDDCLDLVGSAGLVFQDWFLRSPYWPRAAQGSAFDEAVAQLPDERQWAVMERINSRNACHFFLACRPDRPEATYRVDFTSPRFGEYVPSLRYRCALEGMQLQRPGWSVDLEPAQEALVARVDGRNTMDQIISGAASDAVLRNVGRDDLEQFARELFQSLWRLDILAIELPAAGDAQAT